MARWLVGMPFLIFSLRPSSSIKTSSWPFLLSSFFYTSKRRYCTVYLILTTDSEIDHTYRSPCQLPADRETLIKAHIHVQTLTRRSVPTVPIVPIDGIVSERWFSSAPNEQAGEAENIVPAVPLVSLVPSVTNVPIDGIMAERWVSSIPNEQAGEAENIVSLVPSEAIS